MFPFLAPQAGFICAFVSSPIGHSQKEHHGYPTARLHFKRFYLFQYALTAISRSAPLYRRLVSPCWPSKSSIRGAQGSRALCVNPYFSQASLVPFVLTFQVKFIGAFASAPDSPLSKSSNVSIVGAGHSASLVVKAIKQGLLSAKALVAVAPTWAGPLPIVFGREPKVQNR
jgi:hypothetical protein